MKAVKEIEVFVDGASRGNPGVSGVGIFIKNKKTSQAILEKGYFLSKNITNNKAEYLALYISLILIKKLSTEDQKFKINFFSDSQLLVNQIKGIYKVKNAELKKIKDAIDCLISELNFSISHVLREKNQIADKLANKALDENIQAPKYITDKINIFL